ncbi:MAG: SLC13/DASS family transporter [Candidatus Aminicenantes bacterium]|nr:MAG: SLC13/DASS family transporter [Candidatus Aminicenantes bacterium]
MATVETSVKPRSYFIFRRKKRYDINWRRVFFMSLGVALFFAVFMSPPWPAAIDPMGDAFELSNQGKAALGLFLLAAVWWVFEVVPIGVTSITIGVVQALFLIRPDIMLAGSQTTVGGAELAFKEFMHPSVWFIFGSIVIGMVFTKTGLTKRLAYKMLVLVGEKTSRIYLGCFIMTAALTLVMAHTAVAATVFPLLVAIYRLYDEGDQPTRFGKGLFIGMAYVAGAGSIITLLGAARGAVALGFYKEITGQDISFFGLTWYMIPVGWTMVFVLWGFFMVFYKPERATIPGLRQRAKDLYTHLGPVTAKEIQAAVIVITAVSIMSLRSFIPALKGLDKSGIILLATVLFFVLRILDIGDLEDVPWNIILLFGGAMSLGYCLVLTGAADWLAINTVSGLKTAPALVFILGMAFFVMIMTNLIMNVAAIAICLPVALKVAPYLGVGGEVILFAALVTAGMPFLLLVGAAPNAIAYESRQFTSGEFFKAGIPASLLLMAVVALFVIVIWPIMGMEVTIPKQ